MGDVTFKRCKNILSRDQYINALCTQERIGGGGGIVPSPRVETWLLGVRVSVSVLVR